MEKIEQILIRIMLLCGLCIIFCWLFVWPATPRYTHVMTEDEIWEWEHSEEYMRNHPEEFLDEDEEVEEIRFDTFKAEKLRKKEITGKKRGHYVTATIYNATVEQCNSDPLQPADPKVKIDKKKLRAGKLKWIAISRDLQQHYKFGDKVKIICKDDPRLNGIYEIHDLLNARYNRRIDILMHEDKNSEFPRGIWRNVEIKKISCDK